MRAKITTEGIVSGDVVVNASDPSTPLGAYHAEADRLAALLSFPVRRLAPLQGWDGTPNSPRKPLRP